jgi:predicted amidophosphoribosyltransferase
MELRSKTVRTNLKNDEYVWLDSKQILMSEYLAGGIKARINNLDFADYFNVNPVLIPTPSSSLSKSDTLWVPQRLAIALVKEGLGRDVQSCLQRVNPIAKSSTSQPQNRPKAIDHYNSMAVQKILDEPEEILLVDDIITRGSTLLGAANKLADAFPNARIRAFAFMRTITNSNEFESIVKPCVGKIILREDGWPLRRP